MEIWMPELIEISKNKNKDGTKRGIYKCGHNGCTNVFETSIYDVDRKTTQSCSCLGSPYKSSNYVDNHQPKLCECGCGQYTEKAKRSSKKQGYVRNEYKRYIKNHFKHTEPFTKETKDKISKALSGKKKSNGNKQIKVEYNCFLFSIYFTPYRLRILPHKKLHLQPKDSCTQV